MVGSLRLHSFLLLWVRARVEEGQRGAEDGPQTSGLGLTWEPVRNAEISGPSIDLGDQNLHFNKAPR